ncbi:hypothetical protein ACFYOY_13420 [Streptomyces sp. NPDC007875]|uniref:hypothetical protein n=1 Tax=Streptomyces sp. NPDC007875 TaxID=3364783 RepID=UPI003682E2DC
MTLCNAAADGDTTRCRGSRTAVTVGLNGVGEFTGCEFHAARRLAFWRDGYVQGDAAARRRVLAEKRRLIDAAS